MFWLKFLMHRVELKGVWGNILRFKEQVFLMHRVELKARSRPPSPLGHSPVPNAPCGVESKCFIDYFLSFSPVPNAPCGVERKGVGGEAT